MSRLSTLSLFAIATLVVVGCGTDSRAPVRVTIPVGATMRVAAESLSSAGIVHGEPLFRLYAALRQRDRSIKPGTYALHRGANWEALLTALRDGKGLVRIVVIPEGFSLAQVAHVLETKLGVSADSIQAAVTDTVLLHQLDIPTGTVEGYLFPDTYTFPQSTTAREAVRAMAHQFELAWRPDWSARLDSMPMSRNDLMTLASIVEKEAKLGEERSVIAAVYMNRLRDGMLLQADPTVQYALGEHQARLFDAELTVDSHYNTYKYKGLPPGPIASPGRASIMAALYPAHVPYKYFVAFPDGHHEFRLDLAAHMKAAAQARRAWDSVAVRRSGGTVPASANQRLVTPPHPTASSGRGR